MSEESSLTGYAPNRRQVICGVAALAFAGGVLTPLTGGLAATVDLPPSDFLALSARLTGVALDVVDQDQAAHIWSALMPVFGQERLKTVIRVSNETHDDAALGHAFEQHGVLDTAQALTRIWYTGTWQVMPPAATVTASVLFYDTALAWTVCTFTKPAGNCGGVTGYWRTPGTLPDRRTCHERSLRVPVFGRRGDHRCRRGRRHRRYRTGAARPPGADDRRRSSHRPGGGS